jgi:hypothetical protein
MFQFDLLLTHSRVLTNAHVLSKGLVFADLPGRSFTLTNFLLFITTNSLIHCSILTSLAGLRDTNTARRNITERYILACDEVFAIADIGRAASNEGVKDVIKLAQRAEVSNIGIICTKADVCHID